MKTPIIRTKYHGSYLSDGCFSPTRNGVFFLTRRDGWLDIWDYYYRQNELAFSHKVSDSALSCIKINVSGGGYHNTGKLVAIGDQDGTVTLMELCDSLYMLQPKEKEIITEMFDRETRKEKTLDQMKKAAEKKTGLHKEPAPKKDVETKKQEMLQKLEENFFKLTKKEETEEDRLEEQLANELLQKKPKKEEEEKKEDKFEEKEEKPLKETPTKEDKGKEEPLKEDGSGIAEDKKEHDVSKVEDKPKGESEKEEHGDLDPIKGPEHEKDKTHDHDKGTGEAKGLDHKKSGEHHQPIKGEEHTKDLVKKKTVEGEGDGGKGKVEDKKEEEKKDEEEQP